jgi:hypothetical protein
VGVNTQHGSCERHQKEVHESGHKAHEDYQFLLADMKVEFPSLTANQLHPKIEKKLWQNLKAQPIPYLTKAPTATIEEVFNYLRDPRVHQAMLTKEGLATDWHINARPFVQEPYLTETLIKYAHDLGVVTEHPAARVGGTRINYLIPCQDPERGFAADGPPWDKVPWITSSREVDPATTDAWQSLRETEALRGCAAGAGRSQETSSRARSGDKGEGCRSGLQG